MVTLKILKLKSFENFLLYGICLLCNSLYMQVVAGLNCIIFWYFIRHAETYNYKNHYDNYCTVLLKCNVTLACQYFPRISILDAFLLTSTRTKSTRVKADI